MPRIRTKICGLSTPAAVDAAFAGDAHALGFVFFPPSPRHVSVDRFAELARIGPAEALRVGVFVDPEDDLLASVHATGRLAAIQLHGDESPQRASAIRDRFGVRLIKAIPVRRRADLDRAKAYLGAVDMLLFDAKTSGDTPLPGGMGQRFDWSLLTAFGHAVDWGLSGGIDASNLAEAVRITGADFVDVSSGVESAPGVKDVDRIAAFVKVAASL